MTPASLTHGHHAFAAFASIKAFAAKAWWPWVSEAGVTQFAFDAVPGVQAARFDSALPANVRPSMVEPYDPASADQRPSMTDLWLLVDRLYPSGAPTLDPTKTEAHVRVTVQDERAAASPALLHGRLANLHATGWIIGAHGGLSAELRRFIVDLGKPTPAVAADGAD